MKALTFLFFFVPIAAVADPVTIRTGEHDTFSRFVISIGEGTNWEVEPTEGGVLLVLDGRSDGFDTSSVFDRIPRDRVTNVSQPSGNRLFFSLNCACSADAFLWRPDQLVIDIVDGDEFLEPLMVTASEPESSNQDLALKASDPPQGLPDLLSLRQDLFATSLDLTKDTPRAEPVATNTVGEGDPNDISATETALLEGLSRAASQGFLDANVPDVRSPDAAVEMEVDEVSPVSAGILPPTPHPGVGISTALDRDLARVGDALSQQVVQSCLPADMFQLEEWGNGTALHAQVANLAQALSGEFGEQPREAQDDLARLYLHFGFGAEAQVVLAADAAQSQDRSVLQQLAGIIDEYEGDYALIAAQAECETPATLWAFLVNPFAVEADGRNTILQSLFSLPQPLRAHIAPRISRGFLEIGDPDTAERALQAASGSQVAVGHDAASTRAMIAESLDQPEVAVAVLSQEVSNSARTTPASLIRLIELAIEAELPLSEDDLLLASSMRQEHRNTAVAEELAIAEAAGRTHLGHYQQAFDLLSGREDEAALSVLNTSYVALTENADPASFLDVAFSDEPAGLTADTQNLMAARLITLGFPEHATAYLRDPAQREAAAERRYLRASAAIGTADYAKAVDHMLGLTTPRANDLRAQAYEGLGEYRSALAATDPAAPNATLEFRAGAWERLSEDDDVVLSTFAQRVLDPSAEEPAATLADRRAILAQSQNSRQAVEDLLLRFEGPSSDE